MGTSFTFSFTERPWCRCRAADLQLDSRIACQCVDVSLDKTLNLTLLLVVIGSPQCLAEEMPSVCECICAWVKGTSRKVVNCILSPIFHFLLQLLDLVSWTSSMSCHLQVFNFDPIHPHHVHGKLYNPLTLLPMSWWVSLLLIFDVFFCNAWHLLLSVNHSKLLRSTSFFHALTLKSCISSPCDLLIAISLFHSWHVLVEVNLHSPFLQSKRVSL